MGGREQRERIVNADFSKGFDIGLASPLNVAAGVQWHEETFRVTLGEQLGWDTGPLGDQGFAGGTDVYFAYGPRSVGEWSRDSKSVYVDLEADVTERLLLNVASRFEDFSDLGNETIYKVAGRFQLLDSLAFRASTSTGFHAPTPAQQNFTYATTERDNTGAIIETGIIPATNSAAQQIFGAAPPVPESSDSYSVGLIFESDLFSLTLDYFRIDMENRITLSSSRMIDDEQRQLLLDAGVTGADFFTNIAIFTNDFDTETTGFDLMAAVPLYIRQDASTNLRLNVNHTDTNVTEHTELTNQQRVNQLELSTPGLRGALTATHVEGRSRFLTRVNYWESTSEVVFGVQLLDTGDAYTVDFEYGYQLTDGLELKIGGDNIFDQYPKNVNNDPFANLIGMKYLHSTPFGINGAYWYGSVAYEF